MLGTDPLNADSDEDTLSDGYEVNTLGTNPLSKDTDNDGLEDNSEVKLGTNPMVADSDCSHAIGIEAADNAGNRASKEIIVTVNNTRSGAEIKFPPVWGFEGSWRYDP